MVDLKDVNYNKKLSKTTTTYWSFASDAGSKNSLQFKKHIVEFVNDKILSVLGIKIVRNAPTRRPEEINYLNDNEVIKLRQEKVANHLHEYFGSHDIHMSKSFCQSKTEEFDVYFEKRDIVNLNGGAGYNTALTLYVLISHLSPKTVIESGIWRGFTTQLIDKATNYSTKLSCFDINLDRNQYQAQTAEYYEHDITVIDDDRFHGTDFAFFDDHVSHYDRLLFCIKNAIDFVVLDDDVSVLEVHSDGWPPIPTAAMIYNYDHHPKTFKWVRNGRVATADISGLDAAQIVATYERIPFPRLRDYTGYADTSLTSILIKKM